MSDHDLTILLEHQHGGGAFVASPDYAQYPYCWLRDGSFIAHAVDRAGARHSARAFHRWVARTILHYRPEVRELIAVAEGGGMVDHARLPPARFTLEGEWQHDDWPAFQLDGYGQWLWSLERHAAAGGPLEEAVLKGAELVADLLAVLWSEPCYDVWEEGRTRHHASTLASVCAGLTAAARLLACPRYAAAAAAAWGRLEEVCVHDGHFVKEAGSEAVDASLLWLATPFELVTDDDPRFEATLERIERELLVGAGLMRYRADTFYGGGSWLLLSAWLAWHHLRSGRPERAEPLLTWIEQQRSGNGDLPEQVASERTDPWFRAWWTRRWGEPAPLLLWSHAMVLLARLENGER